LSRIAMAFIVAAVSTYAQAQSSNDKLDDLVKRLDKDISATIPTWPIGWPGNSALTPTGFGGVKGVVGVGLGYQPRVRFRNGRSDGVFGVVVPVGDPVGGIGFDIVGTLTDVDHIDDRGSFDFVLHKRYKDSAVAIGTERLAMWGNSDSDRSVYLVGSHSFRLKPLRTEPFSRLVVSLGVGNGRFRREHEVFQDKKTVGVFSSASINVSQQVNAFTEWSGQDLDLGLSLAPVPKLPLVLTIAGVDLTHSAGDGARLTFGLGYIYHFR